MKQRYFRAAAVLSLCAASAGGIFPACRGKGAVDGSAGGGAANVENAAVPAETAFTRFLNSVIAAAELPPDLARGVRAAAANPGFILEVLACLNGEPWLYFPVDKGRALPKGYAPEDLVELGGDASYRVTRPALMLRKSAEEALEEMAAAARREGITLTVGSAYRSYNYQIEVYNRIVREMGTEAADRESARPGHSQHQTGLAMDFFPIDDAFAATPAGRWVREHAGDYGWSLSFPDGYEGITGYRWESWHYRYLGPDIAALTAAYFGGIQHYALRFLYEWGRTEQD
jgi:D-alanyl-D-alanine carboxypeptidase